MINYYYDKDGNEIPFNMDNAIACGAYGIVYKINDSKCFKVFSSDYGIYDIDAFIKLMNIDSDNFYMVYKLLYDEEGYNQGYIMKYYKSKVDNILEMPMDYMLDNFSRLYDLMLRITIEKISMNDLHGGNFILTDNDIVIIDADSYEADNNVFLLNENREKLYRAFSEIFTLTLGDKYRDIISYDDRRKYYRSIVELFNVNNSPRIIHSKVRSYKRPIDFLYSRKVR